MTDSEKSTPVSSVSEARSKGLSTTNHIIYWITFVILYLTFSFAEGLPLADIFMRFVLFFGLAGALLEYILFEHQK